MITIKAETNLETIAALAQEREMENDAFRVFLKQQETVQLDEMVHALNDQITAQVDCTVCGACCKNLMINVTPPEAANVASRLEMPLKHFKEQFIEESQQGQMIMNTIPCHFLAGSMCTIYEDRFTECREFPHLHRNNFQGRLFGTLMHYGMCPIIFNVIEALKIQTGFKNDQSA